MEQMSSEDLNVKSVKILSVFEDEAEIWNRWRWTVWAEGGGTAG